MPLYISACFENPQKGKQVKVLRWAPAPSRRFAEQRPAERGAVMQDGSTPVQREGPCGSRNRHRRLDSPHALTGMKETASQLTSARRHTRARTSALFLLCAVGAGASGPGGKSVGLGLACLRGHCQRNCGWHLSVSSVEGGWRTAPIIRRYLTTEWHSGC